MSKLLGVHFPADIKNIAINGNMDFFQRIEGGSFPLSAATNLASADMFQSNTGGSTAKSLTVSRSTSVPSQTQSNWQSTYSMQVVNNTAVTSFAAADYVAPFEYRMEGQDYQKIHAKTTTFGFWFSTTVAGTYSIAFRNSAFNRSYITTVLAAVGFNYAMVTVPMDTSSGGTWAFDNTLGLSIVIGAACGSTFQTGSLNVWQTGNFLSSLAATNWVATSNATLNLTQFSAVEGPVGFGPRGFERAGDSIQAELQLCQRYYEKSYNIGVAPGTANANYQIFQRAYSNDFHLTHPFKVAKRIVPPTVLIYSPISGNSGVMRNVDGNSEIVATSGVVSTNTVDMYSSSAGGSGNLVSAHWIADAGL